MYFKDKWGDKIPFKFTAEHDGGVTTYVCHINPWGDAWHPYASGRTRRRAVIEAKHDWENDRITNHVALT